VYTFEPVCALAQTSDGCPSTTPWSLVGTLGRRTAWYFCMTHQSVPRGTPPPCSLRCGRRCSLRRWARDPRPALRCAAAPPLHYAAHKIGGHSVSACGAPLAVPGVSVFGGGLDCPAPWPADRAHAHLGADRGAEMASPTRHRASGALGCAGDPGVSRAAARPLRRSGLTLPRDNVGVSWLQGRRPHMEDTYIATKLGEKTYLFGVFDGHGGGRASAHTANNFQRLLQRQDYQSAPVVARPPPRAHQTAWQATRWAH
jgi:hypothetical protein